MERKIEPVHISIIARQNLDINRRLNAISLFCFILFGLSILSLFASDGLNIIFTMPLLSLLGFVYLPFILGTPFYLFVGIVCKSMQKSPFVKQPPALEKHRYKTLLRNKQLTPKSLENQNQSLVYYINGHTISERIDFLNVIESTATHTLAQLGSKTIRISNDQLQYQPKNPIDSFADEQLIDYISYAVVTRGRKRIPKNEYEVIFNTAPEPNKWITIPAHLTVKRKNKREPLFFLIKDKIYDKLAYWDADDLCIRTMVTHEDTNSDSSYNISGYIDLEDLKE